MDNDYIRKMIAEISAVLDWNSIEIDSVPRSFIETFVGYGEDILQALYELLKLRNEQGKRD